MRKEKTSIQLSAEAMQLRRLLAKKLGINQTAVIEQAIRELATRHNVTVESN